TYAVFVAPAEFDGVPCGGGSNDYEVSVMCMLDCVADVDGDEVVGVDDLVEVILAWGDCEEPCAADVNGDGTVGVGDLVQVI
ncbi:MAG: hypothetical protein GWO04_08605, partial [Actinobacteria bacterium]|nr:hypothetical protein [Actinomycetota bacterium]NIV54931.1 hypothetical protein [Actinomycetota bacterium]NIV86279.1 hypothetical protein [Actinomycetota bacterium]